MTRFRISATCLSMLLLSGMCRAQDKKAEAPEGPAKFYNLDFRVVSLGENGGIGGERHYKEAVAANADNHPSELRSGDRVPVQQGPGQYTYLDVGTNIDVERVVDTGGNLQMFVTAEVSTIAKGPHITVTSEARTPTEGLDNPLIRRSNWKSRITVPIGKPTIIFSSDNVSDKGKTELELTATPIK